MKFVDEAIIHVSAGKGGNGCVSFLRARFMPNGGPNGGDGGDGGSVYLIGNPALNTLIDFRNHKLYNAEKGRNGEGKNCNGHKGKDLFIPVPLGTIIYNHETGEVIDDITSDQQKILVARGGIHGVGNTRFKSSTNRAPRQFTPGQEGEKHTLRLELKLLADVGLLGLPNAGKSTFLASVSSAKPKIADYPFTTLHPSLGVIQLSDYRSFVIADIPGLIEGASQGVGLGLQFLRHLKRTKLLLHLVDINDVVARNDAHNISIIEQELEQFDPTLADKERWLVFTKIDTMLEEEAQKLCNAIIKDIQWKHRWFMISSLSKKGTDKLINTIMNTLQND